MLHVVDIPYELIDPTSNPSHFLMMSSLSRFSRLGLSTRRMSVGTSLRSYASTTSTFPPLPSHPPKPPGSTSSKTTSSSGPKSQVQSSPEPEAIPTRLLGSREEIERKKELAKERYREALEKRMKE